MSAPPSHNDHSNLVWGMAILIAILLLLLPVGLWLWRQADKGQNNAEPRPGAPAKLTAEQKTELWRIKEQALAELENHKFLAAIEPLKTLTNQLPDDPLGPRDETIAHLMALEAGQVGYDAAVGVLETLQAQQPESPITAILAARIHMAGSQTEQARDALVRGLETSPDDVTLWFALAGLQRDSQEETLRGEALDSFQRVFQLAPNNLAALWNLLQSQAVVKDETIVETLAAAKPLIEPIALQAEEAGVDLVGEIDEALRAAEEGRQDELFRHAFVVANVIKGQPLARRDGLDLTPPPLSFALQDFQPVFYENWAKPATGEPSEPVIEVTFTLQAADSAGLPVANVLDIVAADFDLDERSDLILLTEEKIEVYRRAEADSGWTLICETAAPPGARKILTADLDEDVTADATPQTEHCHNADIDLIVYGDAGFHILENRRNAETDTRTLVEKLPVEGVSQDGVFTSAAIFDVDHDAMLDLVLSGESGISVWQNRGQLQFRPLQNLPEESLRSAPALAVVDWERDIDLDVIVSGTQAEPVLLRNRRHGRFSQQPLGESYAPIAAAASLSVLDADGNGSWDVVAGGDDGVSLIRTENLDADAVGFLEMDNISDQPVAGSLVWDYDNDGALDLLTWSGDRVDVWRNDGSGQFSRPPEMIPQIAGEIRQCRADDIDGDGDLDLIVATSQGMVIARNDGGNQNHWLNIRLLAEQQKGGEATEPGGRVNYHGIGSLMELRIGSRYVPQIVSGQVTHFGLGQRQSVERVRVVWANGFPQNILTPESDSHICDRKLLLGSCPYLYTWNGEAFEFCTDLCWAAPLGLKFAEDVLAPSRAWEYLKIDGEKLQARDGVYQLRVTEELWEAAYFDRIGLFAVDHPAEVEIFTNEKVGPPSIAEHQIHTVRQRRLPLSAQDKRGRDLLQELSATDEVFAKPFERRLKQGLVEDHYIELDLGDLSQAKKIKLYLTGWVFPTDTSLNIHLARDPSWPSPRPPAILAPDVEGNWQETMPYCGFPGGKTKTIAVDITGAFLTDDYRLRLATNMEFYWDAIFFTVDEQPAEIREIELKLISADLRYRGYSVIEHPDGHGPDRYLYHQLQSDFSWPPMRGRFTRYGDVAELLTDRDDRMAIIGGGDEIALSFAVPDVPLPEGWRRDFVMYNVGWDKDANLNTAYGQDVEPLPFEAMSGYPYPEEEAYPLTPANQEYLLEYQTRTQNWRSFWGQLQNVNNAPVD